MPQPSAIVDGFIRHCRPACPIRRQYAGADITVKRGIRPVGDSRYLSMFDRVVVDVIDVVTKIAFVANGMFPESRLPRRFGCFSVADPPRKPLLEVLNEARIVVKAVFHRDHRMQMIRHDHERDKPMRHPAPRAAPRRE